MAKKSKAEKVYAEGELEAEAMVEAEARDAWFTAQLKSPLTLKQWSDRLEENSGGITGYLIEEFRNLTLDLSLSLGVFSGCSLPGPMKAERHRLIAELLACWLDDKTKVDPSPLLAAIQCREAFVERREPTPTADDIPEANKERWFAASEAAEVVLQRAVLWLARKAGEGSSGKTKSIPQRIKEAALLLGLEATAQEIADAAKCSKASVMNSDTWDALRAIKGGNQKITTDRLNPGLEDDFDNE